MPILRFPEFRQTYEYDCGASAAQSVLAYYGFDVREGKIMLLAGTNRKNGTTVHGVKKVLKQYGLAVKAEDKMSIANLKSYLDKKIPVIIALQAWTLKKSIDWEKDWNNGHYAVAIGYDAKKIYFEDPSSVVRTYLTYNELEKRWHDVDARGVKYINFGLAVYGKKPGRGPRKPIHMD